MSSFFCRHGNTLTLALHLQTGSKNDEIGGLYAGRLRVKIKAEPFENKANTSLIAFLAREFSVRKSAIKILSGLRSRDKEVSITCSGEYPGWLQLFEENSQNQDNT